MNTIPEQPSPRKISRRRLLLWTVIGLPFAVLPILGWLWYAARDQVQSKLDALKAKGLPTTAGEINQFYTIPAGATDRTREWVTAIDS